MDYLTTYYKNLCSQLEEKLNGLQSQLNEGRFDSAYIKPNRYKNSHFNPAAPKNYFTPHAPDSEGTEWAPKPWSNTDNIEIPDNVFKQKRTSPYLNRYGNPDAIDIMPEPRKDLVSSVNKEPRPAFNIDLNLLRDKTLSDSRNTIDFSEIKNKLSRVAKNI